MWLDFFLTCWAALKLQLFILCVLPLKYNLSSISSLLPLPSSFTLWSAVSIKTIEWKNNWQVATNHCSWAFVLVVWFFFFSSAGRDVFQKHFSKKAFNSFKICSYRRVSVPSWKWRPVTWQHLFPGVAQASSEADRVQQHTCFTPKNPLFLWAAFMFGNDLMYNSVYCMFLNQHAICTTLDPW